MVASCPLTILDSLSLFSVITICIPLYGRISGPAATAAQGTLVRGCCSPNNFWVTTVFTLCAAALETVIITVSFVREKALFQSCERDILTDVYVIQRAFLSKLFLELAHVASSREDGTLLCVAHLHWHCLSSCVAPHDELSQCRHPNQV